MGFFFLFPHWLNGTGVRSHLGQQRGMGNRSLLFRNFFCSFFVRSWSECTTTAITWGVRGSKYKICQRKTRSLLTWFLIFFKKTVKYQAVSSVEAFFNWQTEYIWRIPRRADRCVTRCKPATPTHTTTEEEECEVLIQSERQRRICGHGFFWGERQVIARSKKLGWRDKRRRGRGLLFFKQDPFKI